MRRSFATSIAITIATTAFACTFSAHADAPSVARTSAVGLLAGKSGFCTATLVAPDAVLTAAHCVDTDPQTFHLGKSGATYWDTLAKSKAHRVAEIVVHPSFDASDVCSGGLDLAVVRLAEPVADVAPARIAARSAHSERCTIVGFGYHRDEGGVWVAGRRHVAEVGVARAEGNVFRVAAKTGRVEPGDSGGPLFCEGVVAGVASCIFSEEEQTHARTDRASQWIADQLGALRADRADRYEK